MSKIVNNISCSCVMSSSGTFSFFPPLYLCQLILLGGGGGFWFRSVTSATSMTLHLLTLRAVAHLQTRKQKHGHKVNKMQWCDLHNPLSVQNQNVETKQFWSQLTLLVNLESL